MTREDIIRMAREAGFTQEDHHAIYANLVYLAILVAAAEREACAQTCEERHANGNYQHDTRHECAEAIRARGQP